MKHRVKTHKIGRDCKHRKALLNNLATSILLKGLSEEQTERSVTTTLARAKAVCGLVERLITYAKKGDLTAKRMARKSINNRKAFTGLFEAIGERYKDRKGGYTRILKLSGNRHGDNAEMAMISLVEDEIKSKPKKKSKDKKAQAKPAVKQAAKPKSKAEAKEKSAEKNEKPAEEKAQAQEAADSGKAEAVPKKIKSTVEKTKEPAEKPPEEKPKAKKPAEKKSPEAKEKSAAKPKEVKPADKVSELKEAEGKTAAPKPEKGNAEDKKEEK